MKAVLLIGQSIMQSNAVYYSGLSNMVHSSANNILIVSTFPQYF